MSHLIRLDHVHYRASSSDFSETRRFYVDIMEAEDLGTVDLGEAGNRQPNLVIQLGGMMLLFAQPAAESPESPEPNGIRLGAYHIAFLVKDCDKAFDYYVERGAPVAKQPFLAGDKIRAAFLSAPDGMTVELKEDLP